MPVAEQPVIEGWRGVLVATGLGTPMSRAVTAGLTCGCCSYALKAPAMCFREDGSVRPMGGRADAAQWHFLLTPVLVATTVFLFT
jgi:hypothetical protein